MLTHSPPLPLIIYYPGRLAVRGRGCHDVLFAFQHRERVRRVHIRAPGASLPCLLNAMDGEYQVLQRLVIHSHTEKPCAASAGTADSELLRRAESLVTLELLDIADSPEHHPAHLAAQLARMAELERLGIHFRTALPNHAVERTLWGAPTTRAALPCLQLLSFRGGGGYLEGMLARISAPSVQKLFFAQLTFDLPSLVRFVRAAQPSSEGDGGAILRSQFHAAELHFDAETATNPVQLRVRCRALDWQLASLAQICGALTPLFAHVEGLTLGLHTSHPTPDANSDCLDPDRALWHALLRAFGGTKTLQLAGPHAAHLLHELLPLPSELLPALPRMMRAVWPRSPLNERLWDALCVSVIGASDLDPAAYYDVFANEFPGALDESTESTETHLIRIVSLVREPLAPDSFREDAAPETLSDRPENQSNQVGVTDITAWDDGF
ncbi:hypothetical protein EDB84DRAFT_1602825 [Lactarius hengduanensis]|nr:hypothetical protein EDB84DRAFT_1602825 [Lactarius hengduanensis]